MAQRILFLFSDTGGGHRASTNAIIEALEEQCPGRFDAQMVDFLADYAPPPLSRSSQIYRGVSRTKLIWAGSYRASNGPRRSKALNQVTYPYLSRSVKRLLAENQADLIVSVHPLANGLIPRAMRRQPVPFVTVVTDMVTTHATWYSPAADLILVPTVEARNRGIRFGIDQAKLRVVGQPVATSFATLTTPKAQLRAELGWPADQVVVLLVGGGDGMGPLRRVTHALNEAAPPISLVVVAGRNESVRRDLEGLNWRIPHQVCGFTDQMARLMHAADIFVTKAGPGSISEAFICGLPIVMYACLPGQETGNVDYVLDGQAGRWTPQSKAVVEAITELATDATVRAEMSAASLALARPNAARDIARILAEQLDQTEAPAS